MYQTAEIITGTAGTFTPAIVDPTAIASRCFVHMERAWNQADGAAYGEVFADDFDFVNIRGEHHRGDRVALGHAHQAIFDSIYAKSTIHYEVDVARRVTSECIIAVITSTLHAPSGPLQGVHQSRITVVITEHEGHWEIDALHNTLVMEIV